ncbi:hypothetical protein KXR53_15025 [Inquilinus limosus]|uniref:hypothetical protein n=1 Tax=Inquilinus limosus TaxID=171674 RepID=UPI003F165E20
MTDDLAAPSGLLRTFIADEDAAFAIRRKFGSFWTTHHHRIGPLLTKAAHHLSPDERTRLYFHALRRGNLPAVPDEEFARFLSAYRDLLPILDDLSANSLDRLCGLFCFGFDPDGELPAGTTKTAKTFKLHLKTLDQTQKYTTLPAQRDKLEKFVPFVGEAPRILETLRHLGYRHDRRFGEASYRYTDLRFWGFVLIALIAEETRTRVLRDMLDESYDIPKRDEHLSILDETVQAVLPHAADDAEFSELAARLSAREMARREVTESVAWARTLSLPFAPDEDWVVRIVLHAEHNPRKLSYRPDLALEIRPDPTWPWQLRVDTEHGLFSERAGRVTQNDMGFDPLGEGKLLSFPRWLRSTREKHGLSFVLADLKNISCGRKRKAVKIIADWLAG